MKFNQVIDTQYSKREHLFSSVENNLYSTVYITFLCKIIFAGDLTDLRIKQELSLVELYKIARHRGLCRKQNYK
jgi:hypothetical protein